MKNSLCSQKPGPSTKCKHNQKVLLPGLITATNNLDLGKEQKEEEKGKRAGKGEGEGEGKREEKGKRERKRKGKGKRAGEKWGGGNIKAQEKENKTVSPQ